MARGARFKKSNRNKKEEELAQRLMDRLRPPETMLRLRPAEILSHVLTSPYNRKLDKTKIWKEFNDRINQQKKQLAEFLKLNSESKNKLKRILSYTADLLKLNSASEDKLERILSDTEALLYTADPQNVMMQQLMSLQLQMNQEIDRLLIDAKKQGAEDEKKIKSSLEAYALSYKKLSEAIAKKHAEIEEATTEESYLSSVRLDGYGKESATFANGFADCVAKSNDALSKAFLAPQFSGGNIRFTEVNATLAKDQTHAIDTLVNELKKFQDGKNYKEILDLFDSFDESSRFIEEFFQTMRGAKDVAVAAAAGAAANPGDAAQAAAKEASAAQQDFTAAEGLKSAFDKYYKSLKTYYGDLSRINGVIEQEAPAAAPGITANGSIPAFDAVKQELDALRKAVRAVRDSSILLPLRVQLDAAKIEEIARLVTNAVAKSDGSIGQLLKIPAEPDSPAAEYAQQVRAYLNQFVPPYLLLRQCQDHQDEFKKHYTAILADLASSRFRSDERFKDAVLQRLADYKKAVERDVAVLERLVINNPELSQPEKAAVDKAAKELTAQVTQADKVFNDASTKIDKANDEFELKLIMWLLKSDESAEADLRAQYKGAHAEASSAQVDAFVAQGMEARRTAKGNFLRGASLFGDNFDSNTLTAIQNLKINNELDLLREFDIGGIKVSMHCVWVEEDRRQLGGEDGSSSRLRKKTTPGKYSIAVDDQKSTPEDRKMLGKFLKLLSKRSLLAGGKGIIVLEKIKMPVFFTEAASRAYRVSQALYYAKIAHDNGLTFEVSDPDFTKDPQAIAAYEAELSAYMGAEKNTKAMEKYVSALVEAAESPESDMQVQEDHSIKSKRYGVTYSDPLQSGEPKAKFLNSAADLVRASQQGQDDPLLKSVVAFRKAQEPGSAPCSTSESELAGNFYRRLDHLKYFCDPQSGLPDALLENSSVLARVREQWALAKMADKLLVPSPGQAGAYNFRSKAETDKDLDGVTKALFGEEPSPESTALQQTLMEQMHLTLYRQGWIDQFSEAQRLDGTAGEGLAAAFSPLCAGLADYSQTGSEAGLSYAIAQSPELAPFLVLLQTDGRRGFKPLNAIELLKRFVMIHKSLHSELRPAPVDGGSPPTDITLKEMLASIAARDAAKTKLEGLQEKLGDPMSEATLRLKADENTPGSIKHAKKQLEASEQAVSDNLRKQLRVNDAASDLTVAKFMSLTQLEALHQLPREKREEFDQAMERASTAFDRVVALQTEHKEEILRTALAEVGSLQHLKDAIVKLPSNVLVDQCKVKTGYPPTKDFSAELENKFYEGLLFKMFELAHLNFSGNLMGASDPFEFYKELNRATKALESTYSELLARISSHDEKMKFKEAYNALVRDQINRAFLRFERLSSPISQLLGDALAPPPPSHKAIEKSSEEEPLLSSVDDSSVQFANLTFSQSAQEPREASDRFSLLARREVGKGLSDIFRDTFTDDQSELGFVFNEGVGVPPDVGPYSSPIVPVVYSAELWRSKFPDSGDPLKQLKELRAQVLRVITPKEVQLRAAEQEIREILNGQGLVDARAIKSAIENIYNVFLPTAAVCDQVFQAMEKATGTTPSAAARKDALSKLHQALFKKYLSQAVDALPKIVDAKVPQSSFQIAHQPIKSISDPKLTGSEFAAAASAYFRKIAEAYQEAKELARGDQDLLEEVDRRFNAHILEQVSDTRHSPPLLANFFIELKCLRESELQQARVEVQLQKIQELLVNIRLADQSQLKKSEAGSGVEMETFVSREL